MKRFLILLIAVALAVLMIAPAASAGGAIRGTAEDPSYPGLGEIDYVFNNAGYQFWFTPTEDIGSYTAGHSYHNVYKYTEKSGPEWCGPVLIPDRAPYNAGGTAGEMAYYKIWDVTDEVWVCGTE